MLCETINLPFLTRLEGPKRSTLFKQLSFTFTLMFTLLGVFALIVKVRFILFLDKLDLAATSRLYLLTDKEAPIPFSSLCLFDRKTS